MLAHYIFFVVKIRFRVKNQQSNQFDSEFKLLWLAFEQ